MNDDPNLYTRPIFIVAVTGPESYVIHGMSYDKAWVDELAAHLRGPDPEVYEAALEEVVVEPYYLDRQYQHWDKEGPGAFRVWHHHGQTEVEWLPWADPDEGVHVYLEYAHAQGATVAIATQRLETWEAEQDECGGAAPTPPA